MSTIQDSGERREFDTGAVRDIQKGKGRCDLLPVDIIASLMNTPAQASVLHHLGEFMQCGQDKELYLSIRAFNELMGWTTSECLIEVSKHYEDGADKYGERNWEKGIDLHSYIDSAIRHFLKHIDGMTDERHDRAFIWNVLGAIWTMKHHPYKIDIPFELIGAIHTHSPLEEVEETEESEKVEETEEVVVLPRSVFESMLQENNHN